MSSKVRKVKVKEFLFGSKKRKIICLVVAGALLLGTVGMVLALSNSSSFYTISSKTLRQEVGVFRYEYIVNSSDLSSGFTVEDIDMASEDTTYSVEVPIIANQGGGTGVNSGAVVSDTWGNADGTRDIDWSYPNFTIVLSGKIASVDPVELDCTVSIEANEYSSKFTTITVKDGSCYVALDQMRTWLTSYGDADLIEVGKRIPSTAVNLKLNSDSEFVLFSPYSVGVASASSGTLQAYRRLQAVGTTILGALKTIDKGTSKDGDAYLVDATDAESISALTIIKGMTNRFGDYYTNYVERASKYNGISDSSLSAVQLEKGDFMSHMSKFWVTMNTMDLVDMDDADFALSGRAREYSVGSSGELAYESVIKFVFSNVSVNRSYSVTVKGCKMPISTAKGEVLAPEGSTVTLDQIGGIEGLNSIFGETFDYFDVFDLVADMDNSDRELLKSLSETPSEIIDTTK